jgi:HlyD family secretion protein
MKRWLILGVVLVAIIALVGWRLVKKSGVDNQLKAAAALRTTGPVSVSVAIAGPRAIAQTLDAVGVVQSPYNVKVSPKVQGLIDYLQVREGDEVKAGQVLVRLDPDTLAATVNQNAANVAMNQERYAQAKITQQSTNVGLHSAIQQAKAAVDQAQANLNVTEQNVDARLAAAKSAVTDGDAKIKQAQATVASAEATKQSAEATLNNAETLLNRDLELYRQNYIAAQSVDDQKAAVAVAKAQVNVAQKGIDAANQAVESATAERNATQSQYDITKKQAAADVADARAVLHSTRNALRTAEANISQSPAYIANLRALDAQTKASVGTLKASKVLLNDINLTSPVDGTVTSRALDPGSIAQPGTPILTIEFMNWVYFNASIPVEDSAHVYEGQPATVTLDALPGRKFPGTISHVDRSADPTTHQFIILVKLDNANHVLRTGMFGHISIVTSSVRTDVAIPREAVTTNPDQTTTVMVVDSSNVAHLRTIKLGISDAVGFQVLDGLKEGDKVVSLTYNTLKDGRKVEIKAVSKVTEGGFGVDLMETAPTSLKSSSGSNGGSGAQPGAAMAPEKGMGAGKQ